jgi:ubiquinone/menaquinone biosynthesis C-methylase UbiE
VGWLNTARKEEALMDTPMPNFMFNMMSLGLGLRDLFSPRKEVLREAGIESGFQVLDYGCGPGGYITAAAELVGDSGTVYALDIHPLAVQRVEKIAATRGLANVKTICSECQTGLVGDSMDVVLLYDVFHMLSEKEAILEELFRVLKPNGILSFSDHHMRKVEILASVTKGQLFRLSQQGNSTYAFSKQPASLPG